VVGYDTRERAMKLSKRRIIGIVLVVYALFMYIVAVDPLFEYGFAVGILTSPLVNFICLIAGLVLIFKKPKEKKEKIIN